LKSYIKFIFVVLLASCDGDVNNSNLEISNFIKPEYSFKESSFNCNLVADKTLNSVERFIPKFVDSFKKMGGDAEELYFLFPVTENKTKTQSFELLLKHNEVNSLDKFNLALTALNFNEIAICNTSAISRNSFKLTNQPIASSPVIAEVLECEYKDGFNYATIKLVLEQFTDALIQNNSSVNIFYSEKSKYNNSFQWTNLFSSLESRKVFVQDWQASQISKEIQKLLLEQSTCQSSKVFRRYKVF
jgi:hypothetical protein